MASTRVVCRNSSRFAKRDALTGNLQLTLFTRHITRPEKSVTSSTSQNKVRPLILLHFARI